MTVQRVWSVEGFVDSQAAAGLTLEGSLIGVFLSYVLPHVVWTTEPAVAVRALMCLRDWLLRPCEFTSCYIDWRCGRNIRLPLIRVFEGGVLWICHSVSPTSVQDGGIGDW